jgi:hypothetical protein
MVVERAPWLLTASDSGFASCCNTRHVTEEDFDHGGPIRWENLRSRVRPPGCRLELLFSWQFGCGVSTYLYCEAFPLIARPTRTGG